MVVGGCQQETLDPGLMLFGTCQQCVPVISRELVLPNEFDPVSPSFKVKDITTELSGIEFVREHQFPKDYNYTFLTSAKWHETRIRGFPLTTSNHHLIINNVNIIYTY
ncbi:unnamed protein product [Schistosoma mattheei]|uniref:Uncharacterized protein n=1 Tax=Schistosoma mattheei TaxID=31246 RepID=A0A183NYE1_9TREM|nr:unnamed protein product [Schistosoma mattheei]